MRGTLAILFGAGGMLATSIERAVNARGEADHWLFLSEAAVDITDKAAVRSLIEAAKPRWVINTAAWTNVDGAETNRDAAFLVNAEAPRLLAEICRETKATLLHLSTDYVFDGSQTTPWCEDDAPNPVNVYGESKLAGERAIQESGVEYLIVRSSWLFAAHGNNFVRTMLDLLSDEPKIRVVNDQRGRPTSADDLAAILLELMEHEARGIVHATNDGEASWHDIACQIHDSIRSTCTIEACATDEFPRPAHRPGYSVLAIERLNELCGQAPRPWTEALDDVLRVLVRPVIEVRPQAGASIPNPPSTSPA